MYTVIPTVFARLKKKISNLALMISQIDSTYSLVLAIINVQIEYVLALRGLSFTTVDM